jgi:hypothetical protein
MKRTTPDTDTPSETGYGIYVHANHDWLRARETSLAVLVFRTKATASAYLTSQSAVHGEVLPFEWRE